MCECVCVFVSIGNCYVININLLLSYISHLMSCRSRTLHYNTETPGRVQCYGSPGSRGYIPEHPRTVFGLLSSSG